MAAIGHSRGNSSQGQLASFSASTSSPLPGSVKLKVNVDKNDLGSLNEFSPKATFVIFNANDVPVHFAITSVFESIASAPLPSSKKEAIEEYVLIEPSRGVLSAKKKTDPITITYKNVSNLPLKGEIIVRFRVNPEDPQPGSGKTQISLQLDQRSPSWSLTFFWPILALFVVSAVIERVAAPSPFVYLLLGILFTGYQCQKIVDARNGRLFS